MVSFSTDSRKDMRRLFVKGDIDGLFGLGLDNLVNLILMSSLCLGFLKFSNELFYGQILLGAALTILGVLHSFRIIYSDIVSDFTPAWKWFWGYIALDVGIDDPK